MQSLQWGLEAIKVLLAYLFVMYIWPYVVIGQVSKQIVSITNRLERLLICSMLSLSLLTILIVIMSPLGLFKRPIVLSVYIVVFLYFLYKKKSAVIFSVLDNVQSIHSGVLKPKRFIWNHFKSILRAVKDTVLDLYKNGDIAKLVLILAIFLQFFQLYYIESSTHVLGQYDDWVHISWVYAMKHGEIFSKGVYPIGLHVIIYMMSLFGVKLYSIALFLMCFHMITIMITIYLFAKSLISNKNVIAIVMMIVALYSDKRIILSIQRLNGTLPQEFSLFAIFLALYGYVKILEILRLRTYDVDTGFQKYLIMVLASLAVTLAIHPYATLIIMIAYMGMTLCNARMLIEVGRGSIKCLIKLLSYGLLGGLIGLLPVILGFILGYTPQGSIYWALNVITNSGATEASGVVNDINISWSQAIKEVYGINKVLWCVALTVALALINLILKKEIKLNKLILMNGVFVSFIIIGFLNVFNIITVMPYIRILWLVSVIWILSLGTMLSNILEIIQSSKILRIVVCLVYMSIFMTGMVYGHGTVVNQSTYPSSVSLINTIINSMPRNKYTVVSDGYGEYQVADYGYHENILDFVYNQSKDIYTLPTPYVFVIIEKKPLQIVTNFVDYNVQSYNYAHGEISLALSKRNLPKDLKERAFRNNEYRSILYSKAYMWYLIFSNMYPNSGEVVYEDDNILCYEFKQNPDSLYQLALLNKEYETVKWRTSGMVELNKDILVETTDSLSNNLNRGYYSIILLDVNDGSTSSEIKKNITSQLQYNRQLLEHNLVLLEINLKNYRSKDISAIGLRNIDLAFETLSELGVQVMVRFMYDWDGNGLVSEPDNIDIILKHINQLGSIIQKRSSGLFLIQGLFIGDWGEMHGTKYGERADLIKLKEAIVSSFNLKENGIYLSVRTPEQWRKIVLKSQSIQKFELAIKSERLLGLYNDGILGSDSDLGTYAEESVVTTNKSLYEKWGLSDELDFQSQLCENVPNGGEVLWSETEFTPDEIVDRFRKMRITYLNGLYNEQELNRWKSMSSGKTGVWENESLYSYIQAHVGYRYVIDNLDIKVNGNKGSKDIRLTLKLKNIGFASDLRNGEIEMRVYTGDGKQCSLSPVEDIDDNIILSALKSVFRANTVRNDGEIYFDRIVKVNTKGKSSLFVRFFNSSGDEVFIGNKREQRGYRIGSVVM